MTPSPPDVGRKSLNVLGNSRRKKNGGGGENQDPVKDPGLFYRGGGEGRSTKRRLSSRLHVWLWKP